MAFRIWFLLVKQKQLLPLVLLKGANGRRWRCRRRRGRLMESFALYDFSFPPSQQAQTDPVVLDIF